MSRERWITVRTAVTVDARHFTTLRSLFCILESLEGQCNFDENVALHGMSSGSGFIHQFSCFGIGSPMCRIDVLESATPMTLQL